MSLNTTPTISVLVTCYNYGRYITDCLNSIFNQSYTNFQVLVINDGSSDDSDSIIKSLQEKYPFEYITQVNQGVVASRNIGIKWATGDYYVQIDADDMIPEHYFERLIEATAKDDVEIYYTPAQDLDTGRLVVDPPEFNSELIVYKNYIHTSALVKTSFHKKFLYDEYLNRRGLEDWDLYQSMILAGAKGKRVSETYLRYRIHPDTASRGDSSRDSIEGVRAVEYILSKHFKEYPDKMLNIEWLLDVIRRGIQNFDATSRDLVERNNKLEDEVKKNKDLQRDNENLQKELEVEKNKLKKLKKIREFVRKVYK